MKSKLILLITSILVFILLMGFGSYNDANKIWGINKISVDEYEKICSELEYSTIETKLIFNNYPLPFTHSFNAFVISQSLETDNFQGLITLENKNYNIRIIDNLEFNKSEIIKNNQQIQLLIYDNYSYRIFNLIVSGLPIVSINQSFVDEIDTFGTLTIQENNADGRSGVLESKSFNCSYHKRGGSSAASEKKSYKLNILNNKNKKKSVSLLGMREDNDWILNPLFSDNSRMREKIAYDLWNQISDVNQHYMEYCELIIDGDYRGIYCLQEPVDIKTYSKNSDNSYCYSIKRWNSEIAEDKLYTSDVKDYLLTHDMRVNHWSIDISSKNDLDEAISLLKSFDSKIYNKGFTTDYTFEIDQKNQATYEVFVNLILAIDNTEKNEKLCISKKSYNNYLVTKTAWDLDWSMLNENTLMYSRSKINVILEDVISFEDKTDDQLAKKIYFKCRDSIYTDENLFALIDNYKNLMIESGSVNRETSTWNIPNFSNSCDYLKDFFRRRIQVLDEYYGGL